VAILRPKGCRLGLTGAQVDVDGLQIARGEELGPEVRVALGDHNRVVAEELLQLLNAAA
jgi:hypothetical protein